MQAEGFTFDFAYGNSATDIDGYELAGIAKDVTFIVGPEAGTKDTVAIQGEDWLEHTATHVAAVAAVCVPD